MIEGKLIPGCGDKGVVFGIRKAVFVEEQGFSEDSEFDAIDGAALHALALDGGSPAATARLYQEMGGTWHIGRVAVLKEFRGRGLGSFVMLMLMDKARSLGAKEVLIGAQRQAEAFYRSLGFVAFGEEYMDEHVPHVMMKAEIGGSHGCGCGSCHNMTCNKEA